LTSERIVRSTPSGIERLAAPARVVGDLVVIGVVDVTLKKPRYISSMTRAVPSDRRIRGGAGDGVRPPAVHARTIRRLEKAA
jgi:hypothetical protein